MSRPARPAHVTGALYALLAYGLWGFLPIYWKLFAGVPAAEVLAHRMVWAAPFTLALVALRGRWPELLRLARRPGRLAVLFVSASILALNWGVYIHGVNTGRVLETSLGYFINPLVNVALGFVFLRERFSRGQTLALALAAVGVGQLVWRAGHLPWIALTLAFSFGIYGLLRKLVPVGPMVGLATETTLLAPLAALGLLLAAGRTPSHFMQAPGLTLAFVGAGVVTALPLLWFAEAASRLRLSTLGLFQYLAPTLQFLVGVLIYKEPFDAIQAAAFGCIWVALGIYSFDMLRRRTSTAPA